MFKFLIISGFEFPKNVWSSLENYSPLIFPTIHKPLLILDILPYNVTSAECSFSFFAGILFIANNYNTFVLYN